MEDDLRVIDDASLWSIQMMCKHFIVVDAETLYAVSKSKEHPSTVVPAVLGCNLFIGFI